MSEFWLYFKLGLEHVLDWNAYDHVLFLVALSAPYGTREWKRLLLLVTLFTLGHSISLLITNYGWLSVSSDWIEFLIPVSILLAAIYPLTQLDRTEKRIGVIYGVTLFFGLIHGFGFGRYFVQINDEQAFMPLVEFALGIETAQLIVVLIVLIVSGLFKSLFKLTQRDWIIFISGAVVALSIPMLVENWIF